MTKQEFTNRTLVEVSDEEFNAIQTVYYASDLGKDEFCKLLLLVYMAKRIFRRAYNKMDIGVIK